MSALPLIVTAILSSVVTFYAPTLILRYKRYKRRKKQKLNELIRAEIEQQLKQIIND